MVRIEKIRGWRKWKGNETGMLSMDMTKEVKFVAQKYRLCKERKMTYRRCYTSICPFIRGDAKLVNSDHREYSRKRSRVKYDKIYLQHGPPLRYSTEKREPIDLS